ncbi:MAG: arylsulfatase [Planctomycetes bacterium]|nr:arylsulfatase [Planctomycetota bacterium]
MRALRLVPLAAALALTGSCSAPPAGEAPAGHEAERPHIVLIMADDMGYTDIGCYGSEIRTPHLDALAEGGVRMTQFYNTSRCCPTRAALLTGLYSHQAGIGLMEGDRGTDAYRGILNRSCVTLAEALGEAGYATYMAGKWHVTNQWRPEGPKDSWPLGRGFERFYGTIRGAGSFWDPATLCRDDAYITPESDPELSSDGWYYTDAISDQAARYARDHLESREEPLFLYVAYTSAHWPMHAPESWIARYRGVYDEGYAPLRATRLERARRLGVLEDSWPLSSPTDDWAQNPHPAWDARNMETYAAMVSCMDAGIGRILETLEQAGALENTLVIYLQDNGACAEGMGRSSNEAKRQPDLEERMAADQLQPQIWPPMWTRDGEWVSTGPEVLAGPADSYVAYGRGWANASNTPFRGFKHDAYEGGLSTPLIVHWPARLGPAHAGSIVDPPAHLIDLMPTLLDAAGAAYPASYGGNAIQPMEGVSLLDAWAGSHLERTAPLAFEHHGNLALRDGRWKIVSQYRAKQPRTWELYDMEQDRTEQTNLAAQHPERLQAMVAAWQAWADRVGVREWPF